MPTRDAAPRARSGWPWQRIGAVARVTLQQGLRMRVWLLAPLTLGIVIAADLSSPRFDPVFEGIPAAMSTTLLGMAILAIFVGVFFATYSLPAEIESKVAYTVCTKPLSHLELVAGKTVGMSLLLAALLAVVAVGAYAYIQVRAADIRALAAHRLEEARTWVAHPADLNAVEGVARLGPLQTYDYRRAAAGPAFSIDGLPETGDKASWILSDSGMRLRWDTAATPLAEWVPAGGAELRFQLHIVSPPPGQAAKPRQLVVGLTPVGQDQARRNAPPDPQAAERHTQRFDLPATGELRIPVVPAKGPSIPGTLQLPPEGPVELQLAATGDGLLVSAGPNAASIIGPGGRTAPLPAPTVVLPHDRGRQWLVGRSALPRQRATFRFDSVPPRDLGEGDTAVEIGFSLQSWGPPAVPSAAQAVFVNPATGKSLAFSFTPEGFHSTLLYLDRDFWHGGPLEVRLESLTGEDYLGLLPESIRVRAAGGPFALNLAKSTLNVWGFGTVIAAFGVLLSTRFSWFVSILGGGTFVILAFARDFIRRATIFGDAAEALLRWGRGWPSCLHWDWLVNHLMPPLPSLQSMLPGESIRMGEAMAWIDLGQAMLWLSIAVVAMVLVGAFLFRHREVAA